MKRQSILKVVNLVLALSFLWVITTALLHDLLYKVFHRIHPIGGFVMAAMVLAHVILNWPWIKNNYLPFLHKNKAS